jgi:hypothetical protein
VQLHSADAFTVGTGQRGAAVREALIALGNRDNPDTPELESVRR